MLINFNKLQGIVWQNSIYSTGLSKATLFQSLLQ